MDNTTTLTSAESREEHHEPSSTTSMTSTDGQPLRPRIGRKHTELLGPIEAETPDALKGTNTRVIYETLFNLGRPVRTEPLLDTLRSQATDIDTFYAQSPKLVLDTIFEWYVLDY